MLARFVVVTTFLLVSSAVQAQQIFKCSNGKGGNTYQQTPCAAESHTKAVVNYKPTADAPSSYGQYEQPRGGGYRETAPPIRYQQAPPVDRIVQSRDDDPSGYIRCVKPSGKTYLQQGTSCRNSVIPHRAGMVTDVRTGQQQFMVPGGGNGMIDPKTGQRHELISPPRRVQDQGFSVNRGQLCAEARAALSDPNRTMSSIRAAEERISQVCN